MANPASPWPIRAAAWLGSLSVARASHWGTQGKGLGRGTPCAAAMAGERGGASPGRARATSGVRYRLRQLAQKYGGALGVLTVGLDRARERRRVAGDEDRRRGRYGLVEEAK